MSTDTTGPARDRHERTQYRVLFSPHRFWEQHFMAVPPGIDATFSPFDAPELSADDFDLVMPLSLKWARWLYGPGGAAFRAKALVPSTDIMAVCDDKLAFARFLSGNGLGANVPAIGEDLDFPYILKRRVDVWGRYSRLITDAETRARYAPERTGVETFCQEFVPGDREYCSHFLVSDRKIVFARTVEYGFDGGPHIHGHDRPPASRRWVDNSRYYGLFAKILGWMDYEGFCGFDYKILDGEVKIFELNPRICSSLRFAIDPAVSSAMAALAARRPQTLAEVRAS
ncbi:MAG: hypothetical protein EP335_02390 [Alphaproteobacteria bacterium]|nr:MAG: hypothetical protein EP335_02390 [Alphaproteobacteria bacterium]